MILIVSSLCMVQKCQPLQQPLLESWDLPGSLSDALVEWTSDPGSNMHLPVFTWPGRETLSVRTCLGRGGSGDAHPLIAEWLGLAICIYNMNINYLTTLLVVVILMPPHLADRAIPDWSGRTWCIVGDVGCWLLLGWGACIANCQAASCVIFCFVIDIHSNCW
jgi:hypothetical protein